MQAIQNNSRLYGLAQWLLHLIRGSGQGASHIRQRRMKLLETLPLGGKRQLMLVECSGEQFLVGTSNEGVQTLVRVSCAQDIGSEAQGLRVL